jgi:hypothetical protein
VGVGVTVGVKVAVAVAVTVGVDVGVPVGVPVDVMVGVAVGVPVAVGVRVIVAVGVAVGVPVGGGVPVRVAVAAGVGLSVKVGLGIGVPVGSGVTVGSAAAVHRSATLPVPGGPAPGAPPGAPAGTQTAGTMTRWQTELLSEAAERPGVIVAAASRGPGSGLVSTSFGQPKARLIMTIRKRRTVLRPRPPSVGRRSDPAGYSPPPARRRPLIVTSRLCRPRPHEGRTVEYRYG